MNIPVVLFSYTIYEQNTHICCIPDTTSLEQSNMCTNKGYASCKPEEFMSIDINGS